MSSPMEKGSQKVEDNVKKEPVQVKSPRHLLTSQNDLKRQISSDDSTNSNKKAKPCEDDVSPVPCGTWSNVQDTENAEERRPRRRAKHKVDINSDEIKNVLKEMDGEIDEALEETAEKNQLTATNVKNILRHVISNEHVLAMVRNSMKSKDDGEEMEEAVYEPKLTRSKAKELRANKHELPWPVLCPPIQQDEELVSRKLLEEEFSDESSSDEDYEPKKDEEEDEIHSEDDCAKTSDVELTEDKTPPTSPGHKASEDAIEDENRLFIAEPDFEMPESEGTEADKIALRTRSKLCLNDTPLEAIEASFVAPDITVDMYDTECDNEDWQTFLRELSKPLDSEVVVEQANDDGEDDPEYNILQDDDIPDSWDLRNDKAVKISRKELNALMAEILESAQTTVDSDEEEDEDNAAVRSEDPMATDTKGLITYHPDLITEIAIMPVIQNVFQLHMFERSSEKLQLEEQMRMHVQLLAQSFVLSFGMSELSYMTESSKTLLNEINMFANREIASGNESVFKSHNLDGALEIINSFENSRMPLNKSSMKKKGIPSINSDQVRQLLSENKVFIYPELLPACSFREDFSLKPKTIFTPAEDNLIAIGLEEFSFVKDPVKYIQSLLVPAKTEQQIKIRIKNSRCVKASTDNPIKFYYRYKQSPELNRIVKPFDPKNIKSPREYPPDLLPVWMKPYSKVSALPSATRTLRPLVAKPGPAAVHPLVQKTPDKRKFNPIIPRASHLSPLKKISPILKKYNQQRRGSSVTPFNSKPNAKRNVSFSRQNYKPPLIKPKLSNSGGTTNSTETLNPVASNTQASAQVIFAVPLVPPLNESAKQQKNESAIENKKTTLKRSAAQQSKVNHAAFARGVSILKVNNSVDNSRPRRNQEKTDQASKSASVQPETETAEEVEEEAVDDEQDLAALMAASSTICKKQQNSNKKRNKLQRDLESSLALLKPNLVESDPKKEEREQLFASSYILRVTEALKGDTETYEKFLKTLCKYQYSTNSPVNLYFEMKEILKDHPMLIDDFVAFLRPDQARECGKFKEYTMYYKIREFLRKIEIHFSHQPQHLLRIVKTFGQLRSQTDITSKEVLSTLQPLFRNQSHLMEELSLLLPDASPPEFLMGDEDFEEITIPNSDDENSSLDSCEEVIIPDTPDPCGGKDCPCECHTIPGETKHQNKSKHCVKCGLKFIDGRIYIQSGKTLKPAQVTYHEFSPELAEKIKELNAPKKSFRSETVNSQKIGISEDRSHRQDVCNHPSTSKLTNS